MSNQFPILNLTDGYEVGKRTFMDIAKEMYDGKPIFCPEDAGVLTQLICNTDGDHLEIGSAWGGSALVALKAMDYSGRKNKVVCIDPFIEGDESKVHKPLYNQFMKNIEWAGYKDRVEHVREYSHPYPLDKGRRFATALIDGDHSYQHALNDWNNVKEVTDTYVMFHDYGKLGVRKVVIEHAVHENGWFLSAILGWSAIMTKTLLNGREVNWHDLPDSDVGAYSSG